MMRRVLKRSSNCVDVGCHEGLILKEMVALAPKGSHYAFEPIPALADRLRTEFPSVQVHQVALGERSERRRFHHVVSNPGYSGLERRRYDRPHEQVVEIEVEVRRFDELLSPEVRIHFVKIDVEGGELQVLHGMQRTLKSDKPFVVFEHGLGAADHYGTRPETLFDFLSDACGLHVSLMRDWLSGGAPKTRTEFVEQFDQSLNYYFLAHP